MPTPSSDQPPDPSSPPPFTFSTCPDDVLYRPRSPPQASTASQQPNSIEVRSDSPLDGPSLPAFASQHRRGELVASPGDLILDRQASTEPSSRATTVSPGPQSAATDLSSPVSSGPDHDIAKACESGLDGPVCDTTSTSSTRSPGGTSSSTLGREMDPRELLRYDDGDDTFSSTSMGMDFSSMRVSVHLYVPTAASVS